MPNLLILSFFQVSDYCKNTSSVEAIEKGTPIATFDSLTARFKGHAAIFDSCDGENIKVRCFVVTKYRMCSNLVER